MTSLFESIANDDTYSATVIKPIEDNSTSNQKVHLFHSKVNTFKPKCSKALKKKLRKYKLRRDGKEDQDVLNLSNILLSSLTIKSPNNQLQNNGSEELIPKNYLIKMVRKKNTTKVNNSEVVIKTQKQVMKEQSTSTVAHLGHNNEDKKQTNAFKLLMDSRNKSIGSNSPGKEKVVDDYEIQEIIDKKSRKAKRNLVLQQMAEAKGSIKIKELDEYQENFIKFELEKRAEKFKSMLLNKDGKINIETKKKSVKLDSKKIELDSPSKIQLNGVVKGSKTLQLVNMFKDCGNSSDCVSPTNRQLPKEDEEFLKKLCPSMRKKENMLCYFKKLEKDSEPSPTDDENKIIIKVKLSSKGKKRGRKKKPHLNHDIINIDSSSTEYNEKKSVVVETPTPVNNSDDISHFVSNSYIGRKRKRKENLVSNNNSNNVIIDTDTNEPISISETRPKRSVKKPIKYSDNTYMSSSDEELHIFTPKKKKIIENNISKLNIDSKPEQKIKIKLSETKMEKTISLPQKPTKLAPIFAAKTQADIAAIEAKQKFLHSGVPEQLKKNILLQKQKKQSCNEFFEVVHVQQNDTTELPVTYQFDHLLGIDCDDEDMDIQNDDNLFEKLIKVTKCDKKDKKWPNFARNPNNVILQDLKQSYPMFPVFRTFRLLRDKSKGVFKDLNYRDLDNSIELINGLVDINNDNPDRLTWTDKYKATSSKQIIGNFESIKELRKWLEYWTKNEIKVNGSPDSSSSDFCVSDTDSRDGRVMNNLLILTGPVGSGKTSSVYAVAAELAIKVIEVNSSNKRTGKIMLQDLQEATQSHKVNRSTENSQKSQELIKTDLEFKKKRGRPKKINKTRSEISKKCEVSSGTSASQETIRTAVSLILIDDADIVFEQDDGFTSAIMQLVQCSKRPVILVTGSLACPHLQKFVQSGKILKMNPLSPKVLGTWLDIMCLADNSISQPGLGAKFLNFFKGDIRKTINCLQFYVSTHTQDSSHVIEESSSSSAPSQSSDYCNPNIETEENSSMSWADREEEICIQKSDMDSDCVWKCFINKQINLLQFRYPLELLNIWWTLPSLFSNSINNSKDKEIKDHNKIMYKQIDSMAIAIDAISVSDYFGKNKPDTNFNITSQPWDSSECDNVSELENLDDFNRNYELSDEISHNLVTTAIIRAQNTLDLDSKADIHFPGMTVQREKDRIISRHKNLSSYLNPSAIFDRRALALDYWSSCRNICRIEKAKPDINSKRNNRFCHYLKSLNVQCKSDTFDKLCTSLGSSGKCDWNNYYE